MAGSSSTTRMFGRARIGYFSLISSKFSEIPSAVETN